MFMVARPRAPFANLPALIEQNVIWINKRARGRWPQFHPRRKAEEAWTAQTADIHRQTLMAEGHKVNSWMMDANRATRARGC
jgi:cyclohexanone monooxygenase